MTFAAALFGCFALTIGSIFTFALIVYLKEYSREAKIVKQYEKTRDQEYKLQEQMLTAGNPIYVVQPPKKKKKAPSETIVPQVQTEKDKKNLN